MECLAFTQSAQGLLFYIVTSAVFCSIKSFHFPITYIGLIVTQMHPIIITCIIEMTPELTASALSAQIGIVHLEFWVSALDSQSSCKVMCT